MKPSDRKGAEMAKLGRLAFAVLVFPAILYHDGWKRTWVGARSFVKHGK